MRTPPFLLGAGLLFWGWQSDLLAVGAVMGLVIESARFTKLRWDLSDTDFRRILTFCTLFTLAATLYVFTAAQESGGGFQGPAGAVGRAMGISSLRTSTTFFRWLPMFLFLFAAAQIFSTREKIPLTAISIIARRRSRPEIKPGGAPDGFSLNVSYPYFIVCLFSASIHANAGGSSFFWGECGLMFWALWRFRSRRCGIVAWTLALALVLAASYSGQRGIGELQRLLEGYNAQWLLRLLQPKTDPKEGMTSMGQIGELKLSGRIVIRLQTKNGESPPPYLREASYRSYQPRMKSWFSDFRNDFDGIPQQSDQTTWILLPQKTNTASVNIACHLPGGEALLPLPTGSGRLENLTAFVLQKNNEGAVLADGPGLVIFDAHYGPGATIDAAPKMDSETNMDFLVPSNEMPALDSVISEMNLPAAATDGQKKSAVEKFFANKFSYSLWQGADKLATTNESALTRFLLHSRSGHCEYFATATVLLLRELKIPARYAVGYAVHEAGGHGFVVRERDAHAWCLVWDRQTKTWEDFDTTPASWVGIEGRRASLMQWFSDFWSWVGFEISKFRWGQSNLREYILWALVPVLALLLFQIVFRRGRKQRTQPKAGKSDAAIPWPGLDSEFYLLERKLSTRGVPRQPGEPLSGWLANALVNPTLADLQEPLRKILRLHYRHRFDPRGLSEPERQALASEAKTCLEALARTEANLRV
jgi:hypothetical protein